MLKITELVSFIKWVLSAIALMMFIAPATSLAFTYDELLPDYASTFQALKSGGTYIYNYHNNPQSGAQGDHFPNNWQTLGVGKDLRLKILLPPGVDNAGVSIEAPGMTANFGVCDGVPATCDAPRASPPVLWPLGSAAPTTLDSPRIVSLVVYAPGVTFVFGSLGITYHVAEPVKYETWRAQRSWAGGKGDCDGMGNAYCSGTATPAPTTSFSIAASSQQVAAGGTITLTSTNGTISGCTSSNTAVIPNPTVTASGASATLASTVAPNSQASITCTNAAGSSASTGIITVTNQVNPTPAAAFSLTQSSLVKPGGSFTLSALTGSISYCHSDSVGAIPDLTIAPDHASATGTASLTALPDNSVKITCFSTKIPSDIASAFVTVIPASTAFTLAPITTKAIASTSVTVSTKASAVMTGYWVALPLGAEEPTPPKFQEITSGMFSAASGGKSGNKELKKGEFTDIELSGLAANTNYRVYFYAAPSGTTGIYQSFNVATILPAPESILGDAKGSKNSALKLDVTITPASNHTGLGKYYIAAYIPPGTELLPGGGLWFLTQKNGWLPWSGGDWLEYSQEALLTKTIVVLDGLDVTKLLKTSIYGAYETDAGIKISKEVYTVTAK